MLDQFAVAHEVPIRLGFFFGVFALMAVAEAAMPRRARALSRSARWAANLGLVGLNTLVLRLLLPAAAVAMARAKEGLVLLNYASLPYWLAFAIAIVLLDLTMYLQHLMVHAVPLLWRLHRVHHADLDMDVTTGTRFHPIEVMISMAVPRSTSRRARADDGRDYRLPRANPVRSTVGHARHAVQT